MADDHYDADGDVSRYMFGDVEFPSFLEPDAVTLPVVAAPPTPATHHVEHPLPAPDLGNPAMVDLGIDVDLDFFPEIQFQNQPPAPATNYDGHPTHLEAPPVMHHQHQHQPSFPAHGVDGQPPATEAAAPSGDGGLFYDPAPDAGPSTDFNFMDLNFSVDDVPIDDLLNWDDIDNTRGVGAAVVGDDAPPVDEYANFVPFQAGDVDCSNCHLVREVTHANVTRTIYFLVHINGAGLFQHAIVDRRHPADADGHLPGRELLYFDLSNHTYESANGFITSNIENLRYNTGGQFLDTGYNFVQAFGTHMTCNHSTAMEMNLLNTIVSPPAAEVAVPPVAQSIESPPGAELPSSTEDPTPPAAEIPSPQLADAQDVDLLILPQLEEFLAAAKSCPVPKPSDIKIIIESSQVTQKDGDDDTATIYPSMQVKKSKKQVASPTMTPQEILGYLRVTNEDTEKELDILNPYYKKLQANNKKKVVSTSKKASKKRKKDDEKDPIIYVVEISYPMEQLRNIRKKVSRIHKKMSTMMPNRLPPNLMDEIDTIKEEKALAYEEIIKAVKYPRRKDDDDGSSGSKRRNVGGPSAAARQ